MNTDVSINTNNFQTQTATVKEDLIVQDNLTVANNVTVTNDVQADKVSATEGTFTELIFKNPQFSEFVQTGNLPAPSSVPVGSVRLYVKSGANFLMINTPTGWQGIALVNVALP